MVDHPGQLARYITSFSVVFNVGKLVGPPVGGWLVAATGPLAALTIDAATYLLPIATVVWLLRPNRAMEQRSRPDQKAPDDRVEGVWAALRHVLGFTALSCLVGFFHPGLAPLMQRRCWAHLLRPWASSPACSPPAASAEGWCCGGTASG